MDKTKTLLLLGILGTFGLIIASNLYNSFKETQAKVAVINEGKVIVAAIQSQCNTGVVRGHKINFDNRLVETAACKDNDIESVQVYLDNIAVGLCEDSLISTGDKVSEQMRNCYNDHRTSVARQIVTHMNIFGKRKNKLK